MSSRNFYPSNVNRTNGITKNGFVRVVFLLGMLMFSQVVDAQLNFSSCGCTHQFYAPSTCQNGSLDISSYLTVTGYTPGANITWYVVGTPINPPTNGGGFSGFPAFAHSVVGSTATPTGTLYMPVNSGNENFTVQATDGTNTITAIFSAAVNAGPSITLAPIPAVCAGTSSVAINYTNPTNIGPVTDTFFYTGGTQPFTVPSGIGSAVSFDAYGARGGNDNVSTAPNPGKGGRIQGNITGLNPGDVLNINVGGRGSDGVLAGVAAGGWNGGGNAYNYIFGTGGAGGGASDIHVNNGPRIVVAGGGGGNGWDNIGPLAGGDGGGFNGSASANNNAGGSAKGGTQANGGAPAAYTSLTQGTGGTLGQGGNGSTVGISGGGGGGYYGGGGGLWCGGGGGSSFAGVGTQSVTTTAGVNDTDGIVVIKYNILGNYSILWGTAAQNAGFANIGFSPLAALPSSPIPVTIPSNPPATLLPATYTGTLTITNQLGCSHAYPISVTINPVPDVIVSSPTPANQVVCNGIVDSSINFTTSGYSSITFNWANNNPGIDTSTPPRYVLGATGTDQHIPAFTAFNNTNVPAVDVFSVTATTGGCTSAQTTFTITVNPTPSLSSTLHPAAICDGSTFTYTQNSTVAGTSFAWTRAAVNHISPATNSGAGDISDMLSNDTAIPVTVLYVDSMTASGCVNGQVITVNVNPTPMLTSTLTATPVCDSTQVTYVPTSATPGTTFTWSRDPVTGITNPANSGVGVPGEYLDNNTNVPVGVAYNYVLSATFSGVTCTSAIQPVIDTVYPTAMLTSALVLPTRCDSQAATYVPASNVAGATFAWNRNVVANISNPSSVGTGSVTDTLMNISAHPVVDTYIYVTTANNCPFTQIVTVTVNPRPLINNSLSRPAICDSTLFSFTPTSFTVGTTFMWNRNVVAGITNGAATGSNNPNEVLVNSTPLPVVDTYFYTMTAYGCSFTEPVTVAVNPKPLITNAPPASICDSTTLSFNPASGTPGATYKWFRPYVPGILDIAASGTGNPAEELINTTNVGVNVVYIYTVTANSCTNTQDFTVAVNPTPLLTSSATASVCSAAPFSYIPASFTPGTTYAWSRASVTHITPLTKSGTGNIHDTLTNDTLIPVNVIYLYRLAINGCVNNHTDKVTVTVKANPPVPGISIRPPNELCSNTMFQNFGASSPVPVNYTWSAENATVWATGNTGQYAIVSFNNPGTAVITLNSNLPAVSCQVANTYSVTVSSSVSDNPQVIYYDGQFICLQVNEDSYQWGYDDAATLDSNLLAGETNQNYANTNPNFSTKNYWVMTTHNGCMQKTYYNVPTGVTDVNAGFTGIRVYPNPTSADINVEVSTNINGNNIQVEVLNMLGQKVTTVAAENHNAKINVSSLPSGVYLVDCYRDGVKIGAARFVKN